MDTQRAYYLNLDLIRFLAAVWVITFHYGYIGPNMALTGYLPPNATWSYVFELGYLGVPIFFILSGFVISHVSYRQKAHIFAMNRIIRLMPAFWICMTVSAIGLYYLNPSFGMSFSRWLANLVLLPQVFGHGFVDGAYWTLVYEFVFYAWVFCFLALGLYHRFILPIAALWLAISGLNIIWFENDILRFLLVTHVSGAFALGMIFWHMTRHGLSLANVGLAFCAALLLILDVQYLAEQSKLPNFVHGPNLSESAFRAALCIVPVVIGIWAKDIFSLKQNKARQFIILLGAVSYPLYLLHQEFGYAIFRTYFTGADPVSANISVIAFMIAIAVMLNMWIESPLRRLLRLTLKPLTLMDVRQNKSASVTS